MAEVEQKIVVIVPSEDEAGYIGWLDDMMGVVELTDSEKMTPTSWRAMLQFVESCIDDDEPHDVVRNMSMPQLLSVFEQIVDATNDPKGE